VGKNVFIKLSNLHLNLTLVHCY